MFQDWFLPNMASSGMVNWIDSLDFMFRYCLLCMKTEFILCVLKAVGEAYLLSKIKPDHFSGILHFTYAQWTEHPKTRIQSRCYAFISHYTHNIGSNLKCVFIKFSVYVLSWYIFGSGPHEIFYLTYVSHLVILCDICNKYIWLTWWLPKIAKFCEKCNISVDACKGF